jgi:hypothetical protein
MTVVLTDHALLADLTRLLTLKGVSAEDADRIVKIVAGTQQPDAVRALLLAGPRRHAEVAAGDVMADSAVHPGDILRVWGTSAAITAAVDRLTASTDLDARDAELVVRPLFDGVEVIQAGIDLPLGSRLRAGAIVEREVFMSDNGKAAELSRRDGRHYISSGRPRFLGVADVLAMAENGGVLPR